MRRNFLHAISWRKIFMCCVNILKIFSWADHMRFYKNFSWFELFSSRTFKKFCEWIFLILYIINKHPQLFLWRKFCNILSNKEEDIRASSHFRVESRIFVDMFRILAIVRHEWIISYVHVLSVETEKGVEDGMNVEVGIEDDDLKGKALT